MTDTGESLTGKTFDQERKFKNRRRGAAVLLAAGAIGASVTANLLIDRVQGTGPTVENPALKHPDQHFNTYVVQSGDTLTAIVNKAYPDLQPYGAEFQAKVAELDRQLPEDDQILGTIRPGDTKLLLDETADINNLESHPAKQ
jgi:hypothetical protein